MSDHDADVDDSQEFNWNLDRFRKNASEGQNFLRGPRTVQRYQHLRVHNFLLILDQPGHDPCLIAKGVSWRPTALRPWHPSTRFVGRNPPKRTLVRQGYGGYPPRIHPRVYTRGLLRRRVNFDRSRAKNGSPSVVQASELGRRKRNCARM